MRKIFSAFILIMILLLQESIARDQMKVFPSIMNGGFEEAEQGNPKYWTFFGPADAIRSDGQIFMEGKNSIQISLNKTSEKGVWFQQAVEIEAFKRYDVGGVIKTERLEGGLAQIKVTFINQKEVEIASIALPKFSGTNDWTYVHQWVESPDGADVAYIKCFSNGKGKVWFDDIHFTTKLRGGY